MKSKSAIEVWNVLYNNLFVRTGMPLEIRSDRGREFAGLLQSKCREYGIKLVKTSVQHP